MGPSANYFFSIAAIEHPPQDVFGWSRELIRSYRRRRFSVFAGKVKALDDDWRQVECDCAVVVGSILVWLIENHLIGHGKALALLFI